MASASRLFVIYFVTILVVQSYVQIAEIGASTAVALQESEINRRVPKTIDCNAACERRCAKASRHKMCLRACGTCCARCNCVPPGTSGNEDTCPCYATITTHGQRHKCP
uniref:GASA2 n=1 Tax=Pinus tabuliformis TaxID=88731 RepID=A0A0K0M6X9_PINTB|nr:GASA2 [Pinus tabuliformis]